MLIGEVAARSGISARMLRHYDRIGLLSPSERTTGGYRDYSEADLRRLFHIENLRSLGLPLADIPAALEDDTRAATETIDRMLRRTRERIAVLTELADRLERVRSGEPSDWSDALRMVELLRGLDAPDPSARLTLALTGDADRAPATVLVEALLREDDVNTAGGLLWAVARAGDEAIPALASALQDAAPERRHRAMGALEKLDTPDARAVLAAQTDHRDPEIASRAARARGRGGDAGAVPRLVADVADGVDDVTAADLLERLAADPDVARVVATQVQRAAEGASVAGRRRLAAALAGVRGRRADEVLSLLSQDADRGVALTASALRARRG